MKNNEQPLVSVVTVCFNDAATIESTIKSVLSQNYNKIEYILIDGGSQDGTVDIIKKYSEHITFWITEKDYGIYDAMNKGFNHSKGEWIIYVNSGDLLYDNNSITNLVFSRDISTMDIVYGDSIGVDSQNRSFQQISSYGIPDYREIPYFRHGASIMRIKSMPNPPFEIKRKDFGFALDTNLIFNMIRNGKRYCHINHFILKYEIEGVSNNQLKSAWYNYKIFTQNGFRIIPFVQFLKSYVYQTIKLLFR